MDEFNTRVRIDVPQVREETGLSMDYLNEYLGPSVINNDDSFVQTLRDAAKRNGGVLIRKYEDRFSRCSNIVNDKNRQGVAELNEMAEQANQAFQRVLENENDIELRAQFKKMMGQSYDRARAIIREM